MTSELNDKTENTGVGSVFDEETEASVEALSKYLTFFSDEQGFAINSNNVIELINEFSVTHLPCVPPFIKGIINLRGQIIPIMDMRLRLGREGVELSRESCIIVIEVDQISIGLLVDRVSQMVDLDETQISGTPENQEDAFISGIARIDGEVYLMLDCNSLIAVA